MRTIIFILLLIVSRSILAQDTEKIKEILASEIALINDLYGGRLFLNMKVDTNNVRINKYEVLQSLKGSQLLYPYDIIVVSVTFVRLLTLHARPSSSLDSMTFEYTLVKENDQYYKLLGFASTNINYLKTDLYNKERLNNFIEWLCETLVKNKKFTKVESKAFAKALLKNERYYSSKMSKSVNVLNKLFPNRLYQTVIVDYEWIKPVIAN